MNERRLEFTFPDASCALKVGRIPEEVTAQELRKIFSQYGPIQSCRVIGETSPFISFITYYVDYHADKALKEVGCFLYIGPNCLSVERARRYTPKKPFTNLLGLKSIIPLCNYYIGFNGWNSEVLESTVDGIDDKDELGRYSITCASKVLITIPHYHATVQAKHSAFVKGKHLNMALSFARKKSITLAYRKAFSRLILVLENDLLKGVEVKQGEFEIEDEVVDMEEELTILSDDDD